MNLRLFLLGLVLLLFSALVSGCGGAVYVAQSREAVNFGDLAGPAKDWVTKCQSDNTKAGIEAARGLWSKVNSKAAYEESTFLCNLYKKENFDIDSVEELVPPYCVAHVCVFVRRRADNWWGMFTVQVAKNLQDDRKLPLPYSEGNVVVAVQYGTQQRNCSKDLLPELFSQCFWQEPLATPTPILTATPTAPPILTQTP